MWLIQYLPSIDCISSEIDFEHKVYSVESFKIKFIGSSFTLYVSTSNRGKKFKLCQHKP